MAPSFETQMIMGGIMIVIALIIVLVRSYNEDVEKEMRKKAELEKAQREYEVRQKEERQRATEQERRARQREREERETMNNPIRPSYTPSYSFTNDSSYSSISSGFNYSTVRPNNEFLNKAGTPCMSMSVLERQLMLEAEIQSMVDSHLPMNSIYRNSDGSVKPHDYSAFGIAANTPGIDLAEANMFNNHSLY